MPLPHGYSKTLESSCYTFTQRWFSQPAPQAGMLQEGPFYFITTATKFCFIVTDAQPLSQSFFKDREATH